MRETHDAHYLHDRKGLEAVLRPLIKHPTAMAWSPKKAELYIADQAGTLHHLDPVLGTRVLGEGLGEISLLVVSPDGKRLLAVSRAGTWRVMEGTELLGEGKHPFFGNLDALFYLDRIIIAGDSMDGRMMLAAKIGGPEKKIRLPDRVVPFLGDEDSLCLGRATEAGLQVVRFGKTVRFPPVEPTKHRLVVTGRFVLGLTGTGVVVWPRTGGSPRTLRLPDITAGDVHKDGDLVALGTRGGAVALAPMEARVRGDQFDLVRAFERRITVVTFSQRGRWLATGAEGVQLWTWE
ncbi:MAG: hypothetical protein JXX28_10110 [Deltaproteobacteria bacterium]|nr:hypothetical protein [Deltaproteobacteria bacterium]